MSYSRKLKSLGQALLQQKEEGRSLDNPMLRALASSVTREEYQEAMAVLCDHGLCNCADVLKIISGMVHERV